jgi:hypothetical protein
MEIEFTEGKIYFNKELNHLDKLAVEFSRLLSGHKIGHVFISGYVAILFGRNRSSEDIDVICKKVSFDKFIKFWDDCIKKFECIITADPKDAYHNYLLNKNAIRFAYKDKIIPNVELKFCSNDMHNEALSKAISVFVNNQFLPIPGLEQQIAFKLYLGSEKDIEDARFLFKLFEERLVLSNLDDYLISLKVDKELARTYLGWL